MADLAICEAAEVEWASYVIELNDGEMYYTLPSDIISVRTVEYSFDGVTYEKVLTPATLEDLDRISIGWQDDTGSDPSLYVLLSAPGSGDNSQILVWRPVASTSGEKIRINYTKCRENVSSLASVTAPNDIMETVYLPYVLSILFTDEDMELANMYMGQFQRGLSRLKVRYNHRTQERVEALSDMGGY
jgi:hypothetical protein